MDDTCSFVTDDLWKGDAALLRDEVGVTQTHGSDPDKDLVGSDLVEGEVFKKERLVLSV
ncbi:hypothetical protein GCM10011575_47520 [Microlunatus endophyticus]|uniref:Uncharacterized protein n=1 Tax=Microlunatus endophyticus TaxID=1716077 RepID=A0A917W9T7_9ACTN|nr:hypothetical protein GCM10011575_47520 [Microlunatus endophyticus]